MRPIPYVYATTNRNSLQMEMRDQTFAFVERRSYSRSLAQNNATISSRSASNQRNLEYVSSPPPYEPPPSYDDALKISRKEAKTESATKLSKHNCTIL